MSKPFNLEAALAGEPVETRDGRKVTEIYHLKTCRERFTVVAVVDGDKYTYDTDGVWLYTDTDKHNLVMASKKRQVWHCVYKYKGDTRTSATYSTKEACLHHITSSYPDAVILRTYCTEWEE